jgi:transketolase
VSSEIATREAYGHALVSLGERDNDIVVLDADLGKSTKSALFAERFPERFFNVGVAEANLIGIAAGLAIGGKVPFASSFAVFAAGRCFDQLRVSVAYSNLNVKIAGSHGGLATGEDGATHQATEDIALMRSLPNMRVAVPADAAETRAAVERAAEHHGPVYLRLCRLKTPLLFGEGHEFEFGRGAVVVDGADVTIVACGIMLFKALEAAERLKGDGISARVLNMPSVKPLDKGLLLRAARETNAVVSCEDHSVIGGLGGAVAELLAEERPTRMCRIGLRDKFGESGKPEELFKKFSMDSGAIACAARKLLKQKEG